eukprot:TRINITY_DN9371_c0_g5_i1.p1 TRINITY_DN9371_c0_g5~~TRINITY_DN9371_c0_g5_i1.p1  ORF type:complete len:634 (-),score=137.98 TRINITY_DN9371_c0_g5_i1:134-2035(-)
MAHKFYSEQTFESQDVVSMQIDDKEVDTHVVFKMVYWEKEYKANASKTINLAIARNYQLMKMYEKEVEPLVRMPCVGKGEIFVPNCPVAPKGKVAVFIPRLIRAPECEESRFVPYFGSLKDQRKIDEEFSELKNRIKACKDAALRHYFVKDQKKVLDDNQFTEFIMRKHLHEYGLDAGKAKSLAVVINKKTSVVKDYLKKLQARVELSSREKREEIGVVGKYNKRLFCNICYVYACNVHVTDVEGRETKSSLSLENHDWPRVKISGSLGKQSVKLKSFLKDRLLVTNRSRVYTKSFKCTHEAYCFHNSRSSRATSLTQPQFHLLLELLKLNVPNPCFLAYLMNDGRKCREINDYLKSNSYLLRHQRLANIEISREEAKSLYQTPSFCLKVLDVPECTPCGHSGLCNANDSCPCAKSRRFCDKFCICKDYCPRSFTGCSCQNGAECNRKNCKCFSSNRECDPDLCVCCSSLSLESMQPDNNTCCNMDITLNRRKRTIVGKSTICSGYGMFAAQDIPKDSFICEYLGELISAKEGERRMLMNNVTGVTYLFDFTDNELVDAYTIGSKMRYANHGSHGKENAFTKIVCVNGVLRIGLYALREIRKAEEVFFDYRLRKEMGWLKRYELMRKLAEKAA